MRVTSVTDARVRTLLPIYLLHAGMNHRQEPRNRPDGADFYQFLYVVKGEGVFESNEQIFPISEGMTVFSATDVPTRYYGSGTEFCTGWITFRGTQVEQILSYLSADRIAFLKNETVKSQIIDLCKRAERNAPPEVLSQGVYQLLITYFTCVNEEKKPPKLVHAKSYVDAHFQKDLSVANIATEIGISESLLFRIFREEEQCTPLDYLRAVRIRYAQNLLIGSKYLKISEIAALSGFSDASYFCKVFRNETGMTPRTYRIKYGP